MKNFLLSLFILLSSLVSVATASESVTYKARLSITNTNPDGSVLTVFQMVEFEEGLPVYVVQAKKPVAVMFSKNVRGEIIGTFFEVGHKQKLKEQFVFLPSESDIYLFPDAGVAIQLYFGKAYDANRPVVNRTSN